LPLCPTFHPLHATFNKRFGASISETTIRPNSIDLLAKGQLGVAVLVRRHAEELGERVDERRLPRAGNRRFGLLSNLRTHTNAPYKINLLVKMLRALNCPGRAWTVASAMAIPAWTTRPNEHSKWRTAIADAAISTSRQVKATVARCGRVKPTCRAEARMEMARW
jgi:hypothetical protein